VTDGPLLADRPAAGVLRLRLHRPARRNALDGALVEALDGALRRVKARAVVIGSSTPGTFCAGADLGLPDAERALVSDRLYALYARMTELAVPLVAAVDGAAVGGGAQLAVACDLRVAGRTARLRFPGAGHGLAVGAWALPALVGRGRALDLCLTMRWVEAEEALRIGLVDRVADDPDAAAVALAAELARLDPVAAARVKAVVARSAREQDALAAEAMGNRSWDGSVARLEAAHA